MWILPFLILSDLKKISNVKDLICETKLTGFSKWISGILKYDWMDFVTGFKIKRSGYWSTDGYWIMEFSIAIDSKPKNNDDSCFIGSVKGLASLFVKLDLLFAGWIYIDPLEMMYIATPLSINI